MTKKEMFAEIINLAEGKPTTATPVEIIEFASHEIELLEKKSTTPRKPTANQLENEALSAEIVAYLTEKDTMLSIKDLQEQIPSLTNLSNQRISHILAALVKSNKLEKSYIKKTPYFNIQ